MKGSPEKISKKRGRHLWMVPSLLILVVLGLLHPALLFWMTDSDNRHELDEGLVDDASRLNESAIALEFMATTSDEIEAALRTLLHRARRDQLRVSIAGARHSMGGHTLYPGGILVNMSGYNHMTMLDEYTLRVGSGTRWDEVIPYLHAHNKSVGIMQSNNSFSVGGSISVNCHGWQFGRPPICDTVKGFRLMKADGSIVYCSREEQTDVFSLVLGGYGLFGIILDVDLTVVDHAIYHMEKYIVPASEAIQLFDQKISGQDDVAMAYGRMRVDASDFLNEVTVAIFRPERYSPDPPAEINPAGLRALRRSLFRGSVSGNHGKRLRWWAETKIQPLIQQDQVWRNDLCSEPATVFENRKNQSTDILHEYFIPRNGIEVFTAALRKLIPASDLNLLNVTIRHVDTDHDTFLRYADEPMFSFVLLFHQNRDKVSEQKMESATQQLIESALDAGGCYYLPYRLHATMEQFHRAYPQAKEFFARKRDLDPDEIFQNKFYLKYSGQ